MRRLLKFLHTLGAAGLMGAAAALAVVLMLASASVGTAGYAQILLATSEIAAWIIGPSMVLTIVSGLLAMVATPAFQDAGWVWTKAATGLLILQAGLHILGPIQEEAKRAAGELARSADPASASSLFESELNTLWLLLAVCVANIALGVWRPRFPNYPV